MIKVVTDTGIDLPDELIKKYDIHIIGNWVIKKTSIGDVEIPNEKKYLHEAVQSIKKGEILRTAAASIGRFKEVFKDLTDDGSSIVYVSLSSKKSRVYYNALAAKRELPDKEIEVIDSKGGIGMQSFVVLSAAKAAKEGKKMDELLKIVSYEIRNTCVLFILPDISFFARMGRLSGGEGLKPSALKLMTVIGFIKNDGELYSLGRYRTYKQINVAIIKFIEDELKRRDKNKVNFIVSSVENYRAVAELKEELSKKEWCNEIIDGEFYPEDAAVLGLNACTLGCEFM